MTTPSSFLFRSIMSDRLVTYPYVMVRVGCTRCHRKGAYRLARLAERYGADIDMMRLLTMLSADCAFRQPGKRFAGNFEVCGACYPDLRRPTPPDMPPAMGKLRVVEGGKR